MEIMAFAASLRKESVNKKLINLAAEIIRGQNSKECLLEFSEFNVPLYDGDIEEQKGIPQKAQDFIKHLKATDGLVIASPEYNFSTPGTLKNLIDWVSRDRPMPWMGKPVLLLSASPSMAGGSRGLLHTRVPLEICGAHVFPQMFFLANAYEAFNDAGQLKDHELYQNLQKIITSFLRFTDKMKKAN